MKEPWSKPRLSLVSTGLWKCESQWRHPSGHDLLRRIAFGVTPSDAYNYWQNATTTMTIKTKPATAEYRDGYDRIFSKQPVSAFGRATIKMEDGVCDPDELEWDFRDSTELATYKDWKAQFDAEQDRLYGITK